jgi:bacterioferritin-associated ferredoxin
MKNIISVELNSRDRIELSNQADGSEKIHAIACTECLQLLRSNLKSGKKVSEWTIPIGQAHSDLLIKELILKAKGEWLFPIQTDDMSNFELCHCRAVTAQRVDQAIIAGAHTMEQVRLATSASTGCGTCWPEIEKIIEYRLGKS